MGLSAGSSVGYPPQFLHPFRSDPISAPIAWSAGLFAEYFRVGLGGPIFYVGTLCYSAKEFYFLGLCMGTPSPSVTCVSFTQATGDGKVRFGASKCFRVEFSGSFSVSSRPVDRLEVFGSALVRSAFLYAFSGSV